MSNTESRNLLESYFDDTHAINSMIASCKRMQEEEEKKKATKQGHTTI